MLFDTVWSWFSRIIGRRTKSSKDFAKHVFIYDFFFLIIFRATRNILLSVEGFYLFIYFIIFFIYSWLELLHFVIIVSIYIMMVNSVLYWKWKANWRQSRGQTSGLRFKNLIWYLVGGMIYTSVYAWHTHSILHTLFVCWTLLCKCGVSLEDLLLNLNWSLWL